MMFEGGGGGGKEKKHCKFLVALVANPRKFDFKQFVFLLFTGFINSLGLGIREVLKKEVF